MAGNKTPVDLALEKYGKDFIEGMRDILKQQATPDRAMLDYFLQRREISPAAPGCEAHEDDREEHIEEFLCKMALYAPVEWYKIVSGRDLPAGVENDFKAIGVAFDASSRVRRAGIEYYHQQRALHDARQARDEHVSRPMTECLYGKCGAEGSPEVLDMTELPRKPMGCMRIVAISDTHLLHTDLHVPAGDILVHGGDLSYEESRSSDARVFQDYCDTSGRDFRSRAFQHWFRDSGLHAAKALQWLKDLKGFKEKFLIAGNHDYILGEIGNDAAQALCHDVYGLTFLHDDRDPVSARGLSFWGSAVSFQAGLSSERAAISGNIAFQVAEGDAAKEKVKQMKEKLAGKTIDILLTHTPPAGCLLGRAGDGGKELSLFIEDIKPQLYICGHCHHPGDKLKETWARMGTTLGFNASSVGVWNQLHGYPVVADVPSQASTFFDLGPSGCQQCCWLM